jgi:hypothetical protein
MAFLALAGVGLHVRAQRAPPALPSLRNARPPDFALDAFDSPRAEPRLTKSQAIALVAGLTNLQGVSVSARYTGWRATSLYHRDGGAPGKLSGTPYGHRDVWLVTADITTDDSGAAAVCPPGSTADNCPYMRVYHHMQFIVDDKDGQVVGGLAVLGHRPSAALPGAVHARHPKPQPPSAAPD